MELTTREYVSLNMQISGNKKHSTKLCVNARWGMALKIFVWFPPSKLSGKAGCQKPCNALDSRRHLVPYL